MTEEFQGRTFYGKIDIDSFQVSEQQFDDLLKLVDIRIDGQLVSQNQRKQMLAATLQFLGIAEPMNYLQDIGNISSEKLNSYLPIVLDAIYDSLQRVHLKSPGTRLEWEQIRRDFAMLWQFPVTLASIGAYEYKTQDNHLVLLIAADAHSRIIYLNVSDVYSQMEAIRYKDTQLSRIIYIASTIIRQNMVVRYTPNTYFFVGNTMGTQSMRTINPFAGMCSMKERDDFQEGHPYGYRLPVNVTLNNLSVMFPILCEPLPEESQEYAKSIVKACCVLYNYFTPLINDEPAPKMPRIPATFSAAEIFFTKIEDDVVYTNMEVMPFFPHIPPF